MRGLLMVFLGCWQIAQSQCPSVSFTLPATSCLSGNIGIQNTSGAGTYHWDFCSGDLNNTPAAQNQYTLPAAVGRPAIEFEWDGKWYGFVTGTFSNTLYRLEFDSGIGSAPTLIQNLGNLGGALNQPGAVRIINQAGNWFGLVHNTATGELVKLSFGNSLSNAVTTSILFSGIGSTNSGLAVAYDAINGWVCVISTPSNQLQVIRLGNNLNPPTASDILVTATVPNPNNLGDVDLVQHCDQWFGFASNLGNGDLYRLAFGANLFQQPVIDEVVDLGGINGGRLRAIKEGENYFLMVTSLSGAFFKVAFGNNLNAVGPPVINEGSFGSVLQNSYGLGVVKENSVWNIAVVDQGSGKVSAIRYPNNCPVSVVNANPQSPVMNYTQSGSFQVALTVTNGSGISATLTKNINITGATAPDIDFTPQNNCAGNAVNFTETNVSGNISSRSWNFGDSQTSAASNPANVYTTAGAYQAILTVTASNACTNFSTKTVTVYNAPVADFTLPSASPVCTNQDYLFSNTSTFDPASSPTWEWRLNGTLVSTQQNFTTLFNSSVSQEIRLKASIPGCSNEKIQTIATVKTGPLVNFSVSDNCQGTPVPFNNTTTGADAGYLWNFGDATTSNGTSPSHTYATAATFQATLTASNSQGCQNVLSKGVKIYSLPVPDFSIGLPPFSCSNSITPFQNNTPPLADSNITTWNWQFNDAAAGISSQQNPSYTFTSAANFNVTLTATSNAGCSAAATKTVTIAPSPSADFSSGPSCLNQSTKFTDLSSGVQSRLWQIGSSTFTTANPSYTFTAPGGFPVTLSVTSPNACSSVKVKTVSVPIPPSLNFTISNACSDQDATFADVSVSPGDAAVGWNWNFSGNSLTGNPAKYNFNPSANYNVKMTTTHASGCVYTLSRNVQINPSPSAGFIASPDRGAQPLVVQFSNTSQQATTYAWRFLDKTISTSALASPVYTFTSLGDYSAELTATNGFGCSSIATLPIHVLVPSIDLIMQDFSLTSDPVTGNLKPTVTIRNNSNIPVSSAQVALFLDEKAVVNETVSLNLDPGGSAIRTLSFTLSPSQFDFAYLCAEVLAEKDVQPDNNKRCINLAGEPYYISPYPNPTSGQLHLDWISSRAGDPARITIYDSMGKKSYEWQTSSEVGLNQTIHDLAFLASGLYYATIETAGSRKTTRFLRQ